jgi:hypothetical protein
MTKFIAASVASRHVTEARAWRRPHRAEFGLEVSLLALTDAVLAGTGPAH